MATSINNIIKHFENQVSALRKKGTQLSRQVMDINNTIDKQVSDKNRELEQWVWDQFEQEPYKTAIQQWEKKINNDYQVKMLSMTEELDNIRDAIDHFQSAMLPLHPIHIHNERFKTAWKHAEELNNPERSKNNINIYQERLEEHTQRLQDCQWLSIYDGKPKNWLQQFKNDGWVSQKWNLFRYPELQHFYTFDREKRWSWANLLEMNAIALAQEGIQDYTKLIDDAHVTMEKDGVVLQETKNAYDEHRRTHAKELSEYASHQKIVEQKKRQVDELLSKKNDLEHKINGLSSSMHAIVWKTFSTDMHAMRQKGEPWVTLVAQYRTQKEKIKTIKEELRAKMEPLIQQCRQAEKTIDKTRQKLEGELSKIQSKSRRLSYSQRSRSNIQFKEVNYAKQFDPYDGLMDIDVSDVIVGVFAFAALDNLTDNMLSDMVIDEPIIDADSMVLPDVIMPDIDIAMPDIALPDLDINLPEISISVPDIQIDVPEVSVDIPSSFRSDDSSNYGGGGWD